VRPTHALYVRLVRADRCGDPERPLKRSTAFMWEITCITLLEARDQTKMPSTPPLIQDVRLLRVEKQAF